MSQQQSLTIRPPTQDDAPALLEFERANRAWFESWVNARDPGYYSLDGVRASIDGAQAERHADRGYQYLAWRAGRIVGRVNLKTVRRTHYDAAELGYRVAEHETGQGVASGAVALCLAEAFGPLALWRVEAIVLPRNVGSMRVLERNGFTAFGRSRRSFRLHEEWFDRVHYERCREDLPPEPEDEA